TTITENANGTFSYVDEDGSTTTVDVSNLETLTSLALNADNTNLDYVDEDGSTNQINLTAAVQNLETLTSMTQNDASATGEITYTDEDGSTSTAQVVSADANNQVTSGADGGAFFVSPVKALAKVTMTYTGAFNTYQNHTIAKQFNIATIERANEGDYNVTFTTPMPDAHYIIQLTILDCGGNCPGNSNANYDDPGITYYNQTANGFSINIGDSDNGANQKDDIDLEFMLTVFDF
ncbi:hypothetical protein ACFSTE_08380, partial [Aquimarina hainanensis]